MQRKEALQQPAVKQHNCIEANAVMK